MKTVDDVRARAHMVGAIYECYATIRDELAKANRAHGHEEYKDGLYRAMQLLQMKHVRLQALVQEEIDAWEIEGRREIKFSDPRELPSVMVQ